MLLSYINRALRHKQFKIDALQYMHSEWRLVLLVSAFGAGCATYIGSESIAWPGIGVFLTLLLGFGSIATLLRSRHFILLFTIAYLCGLAVASYRVESLNTPIVSKERYADIVGQVIQLEDRGDRGLRLTVRLSSYNGSDKAMPNAVRVIVRTGITGDLYIGAKVHFSALISPPNGPNTPYGYDFARKAYFSGIGGEGYAVSSIKAMAGSGGNWRLKLERIRHAVAERILKVLPGEEGAIAVAILVGYRHYLDEETRQDFRESGLAHLMAISGLHMGLVTAAAFFAFELVFAAFPSVALRLVPRKIAAVASVIVAIVYLILSGMSVATVRAFIMVCVGLLAVLMDRRVLSLRSVAIAALAILMASPESILDVGFQMSFAATAALVAVYEALSKQGALLLAPKEGWGGKLRQLVVLTCLTTMVAEIAVAPFALYHFQAAPTVGLGANLLVVPIFSLVVMPLALASLFLMPLGLEAITLPILGAGLDYTLTVAHWFSQPSFGVAHISQQTDSFLIAAAITLMAFLLLQGRTRWGSVSVLLVATALSLQTNQLRILLDNEGKVVAERSKETNQFSIIGGRRGGFRDQNWARFWGVSPETPVGTLKQNCDSDACLVLLSSGQYLARVKTFSGLRQSCSEAAIVIVPRRWQRYCKGEALKLTEENLKKYGPAGITDSYTVEWSRRRGYLPWLQ